MLKDTHHKELTKIYKKDGVKSGVISLGGNVQAIGTKTDGSRWKVGVQSPDDTESMIGAYEAADEAVITSGAYERYFEKDGKHIIISLIQQLENHPKKI